MKWSSICTIALALFCLFVSSPVYAGSGVVINGVELTDDEFNALKADSGATFHVSGGVLSMEDINDMVDNMTTKQATSHGIIEVPASDASKAWLYNKLVSANADMLRAQAGHNPGDGDIMPAANDTGAPTNDEPVVNTRQLV